MKLVPTLLLAAGMATLGACGGGAETNTAVNNSADELYNLPADDLGGENFLGNEALSNELANAADTNLTTDAAPAENVANSQ